MISFLSKDQLSLQRNQEQSVERERAVVKEILSQVKMQGDRALQVYTKQFDHVELDEWRVTDEEIASAFHQVDQEFVIALRGAADRIRKFHEKQKRNSWLEPEEDGTILGQLIRPLQRVGIYVPGGKAAYPSSVLMNAIPAKVAGVPELIMTTPGQLDGSVYTTTLVAAQIAGVDQIYKVGGAQAIGALAYGTEQIPQVDKIVGPGNIYVALAKQEVYGQVDIDSIAGPSEVVIIADQSANPRYIAADLLAQAEHDPLASAILLTSSEEIAHQVTKELSIQVERLERKVIASESIRRHGAICVTNSIEEAIAISNQLAPEHLEIHVQDHWSYLGLIQNAGAIFLGEYSPEAIGDYYAGPNHVIPTSGTARFFSPLNVDHFMKKMSVISYSKKALQRDAQATVTIAEAEGLGAHAESIRIRF